jgi:hypothetical protein
VREPFDTKFNYEIMAFQEGQPQLQRHEALSMDISEHGLGLETASVLQKGAVIKLLLPVGNVRATLPVFAEVMWSRPANGHYYRAGARFLS